jgi:hypothetical protein
MDCKIRPGEFWDFSLLLYDNERRGHERRTDWTCLAVSGRLWWVGGVSFNGGVWGYGGIGIHINGVRGVINWVIGV